MVGGAQVKFYASIDYTNTTWRVQLREHGSRQMAPLGSGWLRAAHRAIDEERTTKFEVVHDHTKDVPVVPGEICEYVVQLRPCAHIFRAGTQIELEISSIDIPTDPDTYDIMWHLCECETICHAFTEPNIKAASASPCAGLILLALRPFEKPRRACGFCRRPLL